MTSNPSSLKDLKVIISESESNPMAPPGKSLESIPTANTSNAPNRDKRESPERTNKNSRR